MWQVLDFPNFNPLFIIAGFVGGMTRVVSLDGLHTQIF
jgi:hypothetical protein